MSDTNELRQLMEAAWNQYRWQDRVIMLDTMDEDTRAEARIAFEHGYLAAVRVAGGGQP